MRTFAVHNHQGKATGLIGALVMAGWNLVDGLSSRADVLLIDHDGTPYYRDIINQVNAKKTVLFQHGAESFVTYDGLYEANPRTDAMLVQSPMSQTILQEIGYPKPVYVTGWYWTEIKEYKPIIQPRNILFAPLHPLNDGRLCQWKRDENRKALDACVDAGLPVTVRMIGNIEQNGLYNHPLADFERATAETMIPDILRHDLIVSSGTFAHLAVALGKAVVMYAQDHIPTDDDGVKQAKKYAEYSYLIEYPVTVKELPQWVMDWDDDCFEFRTENWKQKWIGEQLNPWRLSDTLERICHADV